MITITDNAAKKIHSLLAAENDPKMRLRIGVQGGGCNGFSYSFQFDEQAEDDFEIPINGPSVLVDPISAQYLAGATVDYVEELLGDSFKISNPQVTSTCGCGSSFNI